jgi:hypothetical protein
VSKKRKPNRAAAAQGWDSASRQPDLSKLGEVPGWLGVEGWHVGPSDEGWIVFVPALIPNTPSRVRRLWRDLIMASGTGRCPRCGAASGLDPDIEDEELPMAHLWHEPSCPIGDTMLLPHAERYVALDVLLSGRPLGTMQLPYSPENWEKISQASPRFDPPPPPPFPDDHHVPSVWLRDAADAQIRHAMPELRQASGKPKMPKVVSLALTRSEALFGRKDTERWERSCDHCRAYCDDDEQVYLFLHSQAVGDLMITMHGILCERCGLEEYGPEPDGVVGIGWDKLNQK